MSIKINIQSILAAIFSVGFMLVSACQQTYVRGGPIAYNYPLQDSSLYSMQAPCLQNIRVGDTNLQDATYYQLVYDATSKIHQLIVLSTTGQRLATVTHHGVAVSTSRSLPVALDFPPDELVVAMQLIYWPLEILNENLTAAGWRLTEDVNVRQLYKSEREIVRIEYQGFHGCTGTVKYLLSGGEELTIEGVPF